MMMRPQLLLTLALLFISCVGFAQVKNGDFEIWTANTLWEQPTGYITNGNSGYFINGMAQVQRIQGFSGDAVRLESALSSSDTIEGVLTNGDIFSGGFNGGVPFNGTPDSFYCYMRYSVPVGDTALLGVIFKYQGNLVKLWVQNITGTQLNWTAHAYDIDTFLTPVDSVIFVVSNNDFNRKSANAWVEIDEVSFSGNQQMPNSSFDTWTPNILTDPDDWYTTNFFSAITTGSAPNVNQSMDAFKGTYACQIQTEAFNGDTLGFISNTGFENIDEGIPEQPFNSLMNYRKFKGYYKYAGVGLDTGLCLLAFSRWDTLSNTRVDVGTFFYQFTQQSSYTAFEMPFFFTASNQPDSFILAFASSNIDGMNVGVRSTLLFDDLHFESNTSLEDLNQYTLQKVFPNPCLSLENLTIEFASEQSLDATLILYDPLGRKVRERNLFIESGRNTIQIKNDRSWEGVFTFEIITEKGRTVGRAIFE